LINIWKNGVKCANLYLMKKLLLTFVFFAVPVAADVTSPSGKTVECYCTDGAGARVELGQHRCMNVNGRLFMARCEMALNVPMWREQAGGCVSS
jgi:hypothetical protein